MEGKQFFCSYLGTEVELTPERESHITATHPGMLPEYWEQFADTLNDPDQVRKSDRDDSALMFSKWFETIRTGRYLVIVTICQNESSRYWVITAYTARRLSGGTVIWTKT